MFGITRMKDGCRLRNGVVDDAGKRLGDPWSKAKARARGLPARQQVQRLRRDAAGCEKKDAAAAKADRLQLPTRPAIVEMTAPLRDAGAEHTAHFASLCECGGVSPDTEIRILPTAISKCVKIESGAGLLSYLMWRIG